MKKRDDSDILDMRSPAEDINAAPKRRMSREAAALEMSKKRPKVAQAAPPNPMCPLYAYKQRKLDLSSAKIRSQAAEVK